MKTALTMLAVLVLSVPCVAVPPHPDLWPDGTVEAMKAAMPEMMRSPSIYTDGIDQPSDFDMVAFIGANQYPWWKEAMKGVGLAPGPSYPIEANALVLLVDFADNPATVAPAFFDTLVFGQKSGTVWDYYHLNSNGRLSLKAVTLPSSLGWLRAPKPYSYYANGASGMGVWPNNTQKLAEEAAVIADSLGVDFSQYDNNGDGKVDFLWVIHAGMGGETGAGVNSIWSHVWTVRTAAMGGHDAFDGVRVSYYAIVPELYGAKTPTRIGVICHEGGHTMGLPDLYDTDGSSNGIGYWCSMSHGAWGNGGLTPTGLSARCREILGFSDVDVVGGRSVTYTLEPLLRGGKVLKVWASGYPGRFYWLISVRGDTAYDHSAPYYGIEIDRVDVSGNQSKEWCALDSGIPPTYPPKVRLEQVDGLCELERSTNRGNAGDLMPWGAVAYGPPQTNWYTGEPTGLTIDSVTAGDGLSVRCVEFSFRLGCCVCPAAGDMDADGGIDADDVRAVAAVAFENAVGTQGVLCPFEVADVNCDGLVNMKDVILVLRRIRGISFPCTQCG